MSGYFLSKIKGNGGFRTMLQNKEELKRMIDDNIIFCNLDLKGKTLIDFQKNPNYKLDEDSFFYVDYLQSSQSAQEAINKVIDVFGNTGGYPSLNPKELCKIEYLLYGDKISDNVLVNMQNITARFYMASRKYLKVFDSNEIEYKNETNILMLNDIIDLHIDKNQHKILFKSFSSLRKLHKDFIEMYREATRDEQEKFIEIVNNYDLFLIDVNIKIESENLKKLKYWLDNGTLNEILSKKDKLSNYLQKYEKHLAFKKNNGKLSISNNKDFTNLSKVIDECFYSGEITGRQLESNSSKSIA